MAPFAKTGGLAEVAGSLPIALGRLGVQVRIVMPRYRGIRGHSKRLADNVAIHFIEHEPFFNRASLYGNDRGDYPDNLRRFSFFCRQALSLARETGFKPDLVHLNDWQTALIPAILKTKLSADPFFKKAKTLLTIHNIAYQGVFAHHEFGGLGLDRALFSIDGFEFYGKANFLKAGILFADAVSTVSPTYARQIRTQAYGFGLEGVIQKKARHLKGILNGIDEDLWNPAKDRFIRAPYSAAHPAGKKDCKADLQKRCGFKPDSGIPVFGMVTRLAEQKGLDLLSEICDRFLSEPVQFVMLGEGDRVYHRTFGNVARRHPQKAVVHLGFDLALAHRIYAGSDFFLMPSYFEPCGLGQMISLKYGTLPVVRKTGGLADTIVDADDQPRKGLPAGQAGNGFVFLNPTPEALWGALGRALAAFQDKKRMAALGQAAMKADFSWTRSAHEYKKFYEEILSS